jgi:hypothetical protein
MNYSVLSRERGRERERERFAIETSVLLAVREIPREAERLGSAPIGCALPRSTRICDHKKKKRERERERKVEKEAETVPGLTAPAGSIARNARARARISKQPTAGGS